jgi:hypothetical protein
MQVTSLLGVIALLTLSGCEQALPETSAHLEQLRGEDDPWPVGERCFLATELESSGPVVLVAHGAEAVVRVQGKPIMLSYQGSNMRGGGVFRGGSLAVQITGLPESAARSPTPIGEPARVSVRDSGVSEEFRGLWTC